MVERITLFNSTSWPANASSYKLHTPIGQGSFGLVWKAECLEGPHKKQNVAIKIIDLE
jgi:serine/threonine protein kinase